MPRPPFAVVAALMLTTAALAEFTHVEARDVSAIVGTPAGYTTWRFVAVFDAEDHAFAVIGDPALPIHFETNDPAGIVNAGGAYAGSIDEDLAGAPVSAAYDSWLTIGHVAHDGNDAGISNGFLGSDGTVSVLTDGMTSFTCVEEEGWFDTVPASAVRGPEVALAQFTVRAGYGVHLAGRLFWEPAPISLRIDAFCATSPNVPSSACPADVDGTGDVDFGDALRILAAWGPCPGPCVEDLSVDGIVSFPDLAIVLSSFGACAPDGACCLPDGTCRPLDGCFPAAGCAALGGQVAGTASCAGAACSISACCLADGACIAAYADDCALQGGAPQGNGIACAEVACPVGACCYADGTCALLEASACATSGGSFTGADDCNLDCTRGACCLTDGSCLLTTADTCAILGGTFAGNGIGCDAVGCE